MGCASECLSRGEQKRIAILDAARNVFLEVGFDVASMDRIATVAGVSKRTIYDHFGSKNDLFISIMFDLCSAKSNVMAMNLDMELPVETVLKGLGKAFLRMMFDPEGMTLFRILVSQSVQFPELGNAFFDGGPKELIEKITGYFVEQEKRGHIEIGDCQEAAGSFMASMFGVHQIRCLLTGAPPPDEKQIEVMAEAAVQRFLYGVLKA